MKWQKMKWLVDEMASWWNEKLMKLQVDEMASWCNAKNYEPMKRLVDEMAKKEMVSCWNGNEMVSWWNSKLI